MRKPLVFGVIAAALVGWRTAAVAEAVVIACQCQYSC
jgi:hypothetical protein